jgi:hypothetical protein
MFFHGLQTQAGIFSNLFVAASFARKLRNLSFAPCQASQAWETEKPESSGSLAVPAEIFTGDEKMWSSHADGIDLLELNRCAQMRGSRMRHLFFFEIRALLRFHSASRIHPFLLETAASI